MRKEFLKESTWFAILSIMLVLTGCKISLIAPYNQNVVDNIILVNKELDLLLTSCERELSSISPELAAYENYEFRYDSLEVEIRSLQLQVNLIPQSTETTRMIGHLLILIDDLQSLHEIGLTQEIIEIQRITFQGQCRNILTLEQVKEGN